MTYSILPLRLPGSRALTLPLTRPFNIDPDCVLALLPEINTKWIDHSNEHHNCLRMGNTTIIPGRIGQGLHFDGVGDFIRVDFSAAIRFDTSDFSLVAWLRTTDTNDCDIIEKGPNTEYYLLRMLADGRAICRIYDGVTAKERVSVATVNDGAWHQMIATFDRDALMTVYVDGVSDIGGVDISGVGGIGNNQNLLIGDDSLSGNYYIGDIDEVLAFNRVIETWEIKALYNMGAP